MCNEWHEKRIELETRFKQSLTDLINHMGANSFYGEIDKSTAYAVGTPNKLFELVPALRKVGTIKTIDGTPVIDGMQLLPDGTEIFATIID